MNVVRMVCAKVKDTQARTIQISARKKVLATGAGAVASLMRRWNRLQSGTRSIESRVLVLEPFGLGDMVSFEPLVRCLRQAGRQVVVCSKPEWRPLFPEGPGQVWLDVFLPWATHNEQAKYKVLTYFQEPWRRSVRAARQWGRGAVGLDTRGDIRSICFLHLAGCRRVLSLSSYQGSNLNISPKAAELVPFTPAIKRWQLNLAFLEPLGIKIDLSSVSPPYFAHLAAGRSGAQECVGLMPVAPWRGKLWRPERWQQLSAELRRLGYVVRAFCGPGQRALAEAQTGTDVEIVECSSVESWATHLTPCAAIITLDSGPMHLADALGVPVVALFGQGWLPFWAPSGPHSKVIAHQDDPDFAVCHPIDENTHLGQKYMNRIGVEEVLAAVRVALRSAGGEANDPNDPRP